MSSIPKSKSYPNKIAYNKGQAFSPSINKGAELFWSGRQPADMHSELWPNIHSWAGRIPILLVIFYMLRNSVLAVWSIIPSSFWLPATYGVLILTVLYCLSKDYFNLILPGLLIAVACLPGSALASYPGQSLAKWAGWTIILLAVGPVMAGPHAKRMREAAWKTLQLSVVWIGLLSAAWFFLRLPVLGRGKFCGVMMHSMLIGPIAGLGLIIALDQAIRRCSALWSAYTIACAVPCIAAGSRSALLGTAVGILTLVMVRKRMSGLICIGIMALVFAHLFKDTSLDAYLDRKGYLSEMFETVSEKGTQNTRQDLWKARWSEFQEQPLVGLGVGMGEGQGVAVSAKEKVNVEPGSSYLALLSMTGLAGTMAFVFLIAWLASRFNDIARFLPRNQLGLLMGIGAFLMVHGMAEGWILAVGSPLCFIFWLWVGRLADTAEEMKADLYFNRYSKRRYFLRAPAKRKSDGIITSACRS
jgi:hypothetical protein